MVHCMRKEGEESARERPYERVYSNGAVRVEAVAVDEVAETLPERHHASEADQCNREHLWHPVDVWVTCPGEPVRC